MRTLSLAIACALAGCSGDAASPASDGAAADGALPDAAAPPDANPGPQPDLVVRRLVDVAPPGGYISALAFHPTDPARVYAGLDDSGGLFASGDRGATFASVPTGHVNWSAWDVFVAPASPRVIVLADAYGHGILRSDDGGASFAERNTGLATQAPDRLDRAVVGDASGAVLYVATGDGVFKSTDGAATWVRAAQGLPGTQVFRLAIDPGDARRVFAGVAGGAVYRTTDGAASWTVVDHLLPQTAPYAGAEFWDLSIAASDPTHVLAAAADQVHLSTDGGTSWAPIAAGRFDALGGLPIGVTATFDPKNAQTLYLATFRINGANARLRSDDGGATFADITGGLDHEEVLRLRVSPLDSTLVLAALAGDGVERSTDRGATWQRHGGPPTVGTAPGAFAVSPSSPARLYLGGSPSIARSSDAGGTWVRLPGPAALVGAIAVDPVAPDTVLAAPINALGTGAWRSTDGAMTWTPVGPAVGFTQLVFDPAHAGTVYAVGFTPPPACPEPSPPPGLPQCDWGVYRSTDDGLTFQRVTPDTWYGLLGPTGVALSPSVPGGILVSTIFGVYESDAALMTFTPVAAFAGMAVSALAAAGPVIVAASADTQQAPAAVHTFDGTTVRSVSFPGNYIASVLLDPARPARVLAAVSAVDKNFTPMSTPGLYLSDDHGATFAPLTRDLLPSTQAWQLALDPGHDGAYYVSLYSAAGGLLRVTPP